MDFPGGSVAKESTRQCRRCGFYFYIQKIPWSRKWQLSPASLSGKSHRERSLHGVAKSQTRLRCFQGAVVRSHDIISAIFY